ncbi:MAG: DUF655 domain-containing protein [Candidatus Micrarchaeia archaeon]
MFKREEYAVVLDFLAQGHAQEAKKEPVAQILGEEYFTLLEVVLKSGLSVSVGERLYIGRETRDKVDHIKGRVTSNALTASASRELLGVVSKIVSEREAHFLDFLNRAGSLNIRAHSLELLPGIGKKHLNDILDARDKQKFSSFEDAQSRVPHLGKLKDIFVQRILEELKGDSKYYLFVKIPQKTHERSERFDRRR